MCYALVIVMTLGGGGRGPGTDSGKFAILKNRMANFPSWVRTDMTNVQAWSDGLLTNVPDHQVFKFLDNHAQINQREMTRLPELSFNFAKIQ